MKPTTTRRGFLKFLGGTAAAVAVAPALLESPVAAAEPPPAPTVQPIRTQAPAVSGWITNDMVFKYEAFVPVSREMLDDVPDVRSHVERTLAAELRRANDRMMLGG